MQYSYCSMRDVIGRVIRNTRLQDSSYIADAHEWVAEAMDMMETQQTLVGAWKDLTLDFHKAKLPCGLRWVDAVEYQGHRVPEGGGIRPPQRNRPVNNPSDITVFQTKVDKIQPLENHLLYRTELEKVEQLSWNDREYYYTEMGVINTSMCDGCITVYYRTIPTDEDGLPLIPDNQNYKQALYWYCRAMMIGAGYDDRVFNYEHCMQQFESLYAPRAMAEIRTPSPEQMQHRVWTASRFLPNAGYYDSFFQTPSPEAFYDMDV